MREEIHEKMGGAAEGYIKNFFCQFLGADLSECAEDSGEVTDSSVWLETRLKSAAQQHNEIDNPGQHPGPRKWNRKFISSNYF